MSKKISLKDIADQVGVSTALVSYVINGQEKEKRVGKKMANKIRQVAKELNYNPNQIARSLRKGSTKTIGLIVADISNPFFGNMARVVEDEADKYGYTVIFGSSDEDPQKSASLIESLVNRQVDGFIIAPVENTEDQIKTLIDRKIPVVLIDRFLKGVESNYGPVGRFNLIQLRALNLPGSLGSSSCGWRASGGSPRSRGPWLWQRASHSFHRPQMTGACASLLHSQQKK